MSYVFQDFIPLNPGVIPNWQQKPVPAWSVNPFHAGPARVGVGLFAQMEPAPQGAAPPDEGEDKYTTTTWGHVAAGAAAALVVGLLIGFAAGKSSPKSRYGRNPKRIFRPNRGRSSSRGHALTKSSRARLPPSAFVYPEERTWPIQDRYHAVKALQYAKWPQHRARRQEVLEAVGRRWGNDPVVAAKMHEYFPRSAERYARAA